MLDLLVSKGARLDLKDNRQEWLPIDYAIQKHRLCRLRKLLSLRSPLNSTGRDGQTPLVRCFECGDGDFMKALLLAGATFQPGRVAGSLEWPQTLVFSVSKQAAAEEPPNEGCALAPGPTVVRIRRRASISYDVSDVTMLWFCDQFPDFRNITQLRSISPIFVNPLYENGEIEHTFRHETGYLPGPHVGFLLTIAICDFSVEKVGWHR